MNDARIIALIGAGHMVSHFLQLTIPLLFPLLRDEFGVTWLALAAGALTAFLVGNASGLLAGGFLADRVRHHTAVAVCGVLCAALLMIVMAWGVMPLPMLAVVMAATGFSMGITSPSRDMIVRAATPPGSSGKVFGFTAIQVRRRATATTTSARVPAPAPGG